MPKQAKVFVYNGRGVGSASSADLKTWFQQLGREVDVVDSDFSSNFSGLGLGDNAIVVIPGGSLMAMMDTLITALPKVIEQTRAGVNVFAVCAGAYMVGQTHFFKTTFELNVATGFQPVTFSADLSEWYKTPLLPDVQCFGPFYPRWSYAVDLCWFNPRDFFKPGPILSMRPQQATVQLDDAQATAESKPSSVLFVQGCGFAKKDDPELEYLHPYVDHKPYKFSYPKTGMMRLFDINKPLCATVVRTKKQRGGVIATGIHPEASVPGSRMLKFFKPNPYPSKCVPLFDTAMAAIKADTEQVDAAFKALVCRTFGL